MRLFLLLLAVAMLSCKGRLPIASAFEDDSGHRLYLFSDSFYLASVGNENEQFYRRSRWSFGNYRTHGDVVELESNWPRTIRYWITQDTLCKRGMCIRFVDRNDLALRFGRIQLTSAKDSAIGWSDGYSMFYTPVWSDSLIMTDEDGMVDRKRLVFPDTTMHGCVVHLDINYFDLDDRLVLRAYRLVRNGDGFAPAKPSSQDQFQDPQFRVLGPVVLTKEDRLVIERRGWNLKAHGHPDR